MDARLPILSLLAVLVAGCSCGDSHMRAGDAGPTADGASLSDAGCGGAPPPYCALSCGSDAGVAPVCVAGAWQCPAGTLDPSTCPPTCWGPPPAPDCTCDTTATPPVYVCGSECPAGIEPWNPDSPANACSPDGRMCFSGTSSACGFAMSCQCVAGRWSCAVAEPDPACWCGRQPDEGSDCNEEGALCGSCCPTAGSPAFGPFTCTGGHWTINDCPAIECPPVEGPCPVAGELGAPCPIEGQSCGNPCCGSIRCMDGVWTPGPELGCFCDMSSLFECGPGGCTVDRACRTSCGPDDGPVYACDPLPTGCTSCACAGTGPDTICEERDGHVFLRDAGFCG